MGQQLEYVLNWSLNHSDTMECSKILLAIFNFGKTELVSFGWSNNYYLHWSFEHRFTFIHCYYMPVIFSLSFVLQNISPAVFLWFKKSRFFLCMEHRWLMKACARTSKAGLKNICKIRLLVLHSLMQARITC